LLTKAAHAFSVILLTEATHLSSGVTVVWLAKTSHRCVDTTVLALAVAVATLIRLAKSTHLYVYANICLWLSKATNYLLLWLSETTNNLLLWLSVANNLLLVILINDLLLLWSLIIWLILVNNYFLLPEANSHNYF
jgi:hypothetical protein